MAGVGRLFVALRPPTVALHALAAGLHASFADHPVPGARVPPELWHVTLRFIGEVGDVGRDRVLAALDETDLGPPVPIRLGGLGAFPKPSRANVLWVGVDDSPGLLRLVERVEAACDEAGLAPEGRPFVGHLTISRMRPATEAWPWLEAEPDLRVGWTADRVDLITSHRGDEGPTYETLESYRLG